MTHARLRPKVHKLAYKIYSLLLDLDELEALDGKLKLFSLDRFNLFSFYRKDRGDGSTVSLREQVERAMDAAGVTPDGGAIRLLTMPRIAGWAFNPLSVFFCYNRGGELVAILWEVDNTFRQRHGYMIPVENASSGRIVQSCDKACHLARRVELSDAALLRAFFAIPFLTLKVVGGIHWEALKIWLKGIGLRKRPAAPDTPITSVRNETVQQRNKAA